MHGLAFGFGIGYRGCRHKQSSCNKSGKYGCAAAEGGGRTSGTSCSSLVRTPARPFSSASRAKDCASKAHVSRMTGGGGRAGGGAQEYMNRGAHRSRRRRGSARGGRQGGVLTSTATAAAPPAPACIVILCARVKGGRFRHARRGAYRGDGLRRGGGRLYLGAGDCAERGGHVVLDGADEMLGRGLCSEERRRRREATTGAGRQCGRVQTRGIVLWMGIMAPGEPASSGFWKLPGASGGAAP